LVENPNPQPLIASLYLCAAWGGTLAPRPDLFLRQRWRQATIASMVAGLMVIVPIALLEGAFGPLFYGWFYGLHPFRSDGVHRYVGFRPPRLL